MTQEFLRLSYAPFVGSLSRVQKNGFLCSKTTARAQSHSPRSGHLCGNLDPGHSSGRKNALVGDSWIPAMAGLPTGSAGRARAPERMDSELGLGTETWAGWHAPASGCQARRGSRELVTPARWDELEKSKFRESRRGVEPTQRRAPSPQGQFWLRWDLELGLARLGCHNIETQTLNPFCPLLVVH